MAITTKSFTTLVQDVVTAIQGSATGLVDLTIGSVLRAVTEANATVTLWLQGMILQLLATTRAATSSKDDLYSWMADFGITPLPAVAASGLVTFSRFTATAQAVIPVGATVLTADGSQSYTVDLDTTNAAYSAPLAGYVLAAGTTSVSLHVTAIAVGIAANAVAGQVALINQPIPGVDTVTNGTAFTNGVEVEQDAALRARFIVWLASLSKATAAAVGSAIASLEQGLTYSLTENVNYAGAAQPGYFFVVVDDGTGAPPAALLSTVYNAIDAVRAVTITFGVFAPVKVTANIAMTITTAAGYGHAATAALVATALSNYVNALTIDGDLTFSRLTQIAYDASPGVINVTGVTLNGGTADLTASKLQVIKTGTVSVA
jgi:uncharacterized phage protein gp47/JayE